MSNIQEDVFRCMCEALGQTLQLQFPQLKNALIDWPDPKFLQDDNNFPSVFFKQVSEKGTNIVSRYATHEVIDNGDGTGKRVHEVLRLYYLLQITLFTNIPEDRSAIGWGIKQYLVANYRLIQADGQSAMFHYSGDHASDKPDLRRYQRDLTFTVQSRVLDATDTWKVTQVNKTINVNQ